ncbi:hypothetical protein X801_00565, partial [Opisthorchis viverrini]
VEKVGEGLKVARAREDNVYNEKYAPRSKSILTAVPLRGDPPHCVNHQAKSDATDSDEYRPYGRPTPLCVTALHHRCYICACCAAFTLRIWQTSIQRNRRVYACLLMLSATLCVDKSSSIRLSPDKRCRPVNEVTDGLGSACVVIEVNHGSRKASAAVGLLDGSGCNRRFVNLTIFDTCISKADRIDQKFDPAKSFDDSKSNPRFQ